MILPSHVIAKEHLRKSPFCRMMGCSELERVAKEVVEWLAANGNNWTVQVPLDSLATKSLMVHGHADVGDHNFQPYYAVDGIVTTAFIDAVTRKHDHAELKDSAIAQLLKDWPMQECNK